MKRLRIAGIMAAVLLSLYAGNNLCYEYPSDAITLIHSTIKETGPTTFEEQHKKVDPTPYRLLLAKASKPNSLHWHYLYLLRRSDGKIITYQSMECTPRKGFAGGFHCHGECDTGSADIDRNTNLILLSDNILLGESIDLPEGEWEMAPRQKGERLKATPTPCPLKIEQQNLAPDEDVSESYIQSVKKESQRAARYVCYTAKTIKSIQGKPQKQYRGCQVRKDSCKSLGLLHFGHYNSNIATDEALIRCRHSTPRPKH